MLAKNQRRFKQILEAKRAELTPALKKLDQIAIEPRPDALEEVQQSGARDITIQMIDYENGLLHSIDLALCRIGHGSFGKCTECGEEINPKRLEAIPWAPLCIACQNAADQIISPIYTRHYFSNASNQGDSV